MHELYLDNNPFAKKLPDYFLHCLKVVKKAQSRDLKLKRIDDNYVTKAMRERADNIKPLGQRKKPTRELLPEEVEIQVRPHR